MNDYTKQDAIMEKLEERALEEMETSDLVIYDVPDEVRDKFISLTKLEYDNEGWRVLADAIQALLDQRDRDVEDLKERINRLEEEINIMKNLTKYSEEQRNDSSSSDPTFGDMQETDFSDDFEKLKQVSQSRGDNDNNDE